jgi:hypothetical protein
MQFEVHFRGDGLLAKIEDHTIGTNWLEDIRAMVGNAPLSQISDRADGLEECALVIKINEASAKIISKINGAFKYAANEYVKVKTSHTSYRPFDPFAVWRLHQDPDTHVYQVRYALDKPAILSAWIGEKTPVVWNL